MGLHARHASYGAAVTAGGEAAAARRVGARADGAGGARLRHGRCARTAQAAQPDGQNAHSGLVAPNGTWVAQVELGKTGVYIGEVEL